MNLGASALVAGGWSLGAIAKAGGGVSRQAASKWKDGTSIPGARAREGMRREFGIEVDAWDSEPTEFEQSSPTPTSRPPEASLETLLDDGASSVRSAVRQHLARIEELRREAVSRHSVGDAAAALELERKAIVEFGAAIVEDEIVTSSRWRAIRAAICRALAGHPDVARAVAEELAKLP